MPDFFELDGEPRVIKKQEDFFKLTDSHENETIKDILYKPDLLDSPRTPQRWNIRKIYFVNVSFTKTELNHIEFVDCIFEKCLFIGSIIKNCRFRNCKFICTNMHRVELDSVYVDPKSFEECLNPKLYQNIGVHLYQELLRNSRQESQPDFEREAQFQFRRWQRWLKQDILSGRMSSNDGEKAPSKPIRILATLATSPEYFFELCAGSGVRLRNLVITAVFIFTVITIFNWYFGAQFGISNGPNQANSLADSFYFSTIVVTSLGFGDIVPATPLGKLVISLEAFLGFVLLAILVSMIFRRISA